MSTPSKRMTHADLRPKLKDGMSIMFGGFLAVGTPLGIVQEILDAGIKDLTIIGNDTATPDSGIGRLIAAKRVKKVIASHIGTNAETGRQMIAKELDVELVPQGTLAERIRCGGSGLGGVLTPTGVGTIVEEGKTKLSFDGVEYLVERGLRADLAILKAHIADEKGNLVYQRAARNFNPLMALAADYVVVEADRIVAAGEIDPDLVMTPGVLVDALILSGEC
ncbi:acetate CoA-transferase subunit alpha [uncultured Propionivibrio sp.]|uniref:acetate CoA-transferase subunit alpha n=1 Tax=uncultured Propionivibrio sp. TaxID=426737 RepID=UPI0029BFBE04|nr:acetate CoA-transferase subunit alpha [uncultured Propionivibrio sp.]